jgi:hypothetical protein
MAEHSTVVTSAVRPNEPARQVIATFDNYADAERAVDYLSDQRFEVNRVAIVGRELEYVEQILCRMNYGTAALRGAGSGALVGALIGWIFGLLNWIEPLISALVLARYGLVFGAIVGALFGLLVHALQHSRSGNRVGRAGCGPSITTSSRTWRLPIVRCNSSPGATERNRRWQQR